jgi:uncharacterized damage-inducible protein DinB
VLTSAAVNIRELLIEPLTHIPPALALERLRAEDAERRVGGANHSIAEIVAHMGFWQDWFVQRCSGTAAPMVQRAAAGWPDVAPGTWPQWHAQFLAGLDRAAACAEPATRLDEAVAPAIEFPPLAQYTIRDALVHIASHNAHHLGQVIVLRQLAGQWPPPAGSWTW